MTKPTDSPLAALVARLAAHEMVGFAVSQEPAAQALTKVGSGKAGSGKPPPINPPEAPR
jgi:hypothetical protein